MPVCSYLFPGFWHILLFASLIADTLGTLGPHITMIGQLWQARPPDVAGLIVSGPHAPSSRPTKNSILSAGRLFSFAAFQAIYDHEVKYELAKSLAGDVYPA